MLDSRSTSNKTKKKRRKRLPYWIPRPGEFKMDDDFIYFKESYLLRVLPKNRRYTEFEAYLSLALDAQRNVNG